MSEVEGRKIKSRHSYVRRRNSFEKVKNRNVVRKEEISKNIIRSYTINLDSMAEYMTTKCHLTNHYSALQCKES
jgi:hypothetical protein